MKPTPSVTLSFCTLSLVSTLLFPTSAAPTPPISSATNSGGAQAQAMALLDRAAKAYGALESLSMHAAYRVNDDGDIIKGQSTIAYEKSGRMRITHAVLPSPFVYSTASKDPQVARAILAKNIVWGAGPASIPLKSLVQGLNPLHKASETVMDQKFVWGKKLRLLADHGVAVPLTSTGGEDLPPLELLMYFDPKDHLLRRVDLKGQGAGVTTFQSITFSQVRINPRFPVGTFVQPEPVAKPATKSTVTPSRRVYWDSKIVVGSEPYPLQGVNLEAYRGKVVLLDFWATWCRPCVKELPGMLSSYQKHHNEGFEIIGISCDEDKTALAKFVQARNLPWKQIADRDYGQSSNLNRYRVKAIPFLLLIGKDGKVAALNPRGEELEPALKKALAQ